MIVYVDASALVKRYVAEVGSADVNDLTAGAAAVATALVTRAEAAAAFARAVRVGVLDDVGGRRAQRRFSREWPDLMRVPVTEALVARAEALASRVARQAAELTVGHVPQEAGIAQPRRFANLLDSRFRPIGFSNPVVSGSGYTIATAL